MDDEWERAEGVGGGEGYGRDTTSAYLELRTTTGHGYGNQWEGFCATAEGRMENRRREGEREA